MIRLTFALFVLLGFAPWANAGAVTLSVEQKSGVDIKGKTGDTKTQSRSLEILLNNLGRDAAKVTVRYWFFARDLKSHDESVFKKGEKAVELAANTPVTVSSESVTATFTEEHAEISKANNKGGGKSGKGGKSKSTVKNVPASGHRITGYAVQVVSGETLLAASYSSPSYKDRLERK